MENEQKIHNAPSVPYSKWLINQNQPEKSSPRYVNFWLKHIEYCKSGVYCGPVYISGWLYWHLNFFKIPKDVVDEYGEYQRIVGSPDLRDNEYLIAYHLQKAKDEGKQVIIFGSRRIGKSVTLASRAAYTMYIKPNTNTVIIGTDSRDIRNIVEYIEYFYQNRPDCFSDLRLYNFGGVNNSDAEVAINMKDVMAKNKATGEKGGLNPITKSLVENLSDKKTIYSTVAIRNLEHGQKLTKKEILAGLTPSEVIMDEVGKFHYNEQLAALKPALKASDGKYRTLPILVGTGGNTELSQDAEFDFLETEKSNFLHFDVDEYKKHVNPEYYKFTQESDKKVGVFPSAEMSNAGGKKIKVKMSDYILEDYAVEHIKEMEGFNIYVTDWENAKQNVEATIQEEEDRPGGEGRKAKLYYPFQPEDCFISTRDSPFPIDEAKLTLAKIKRENRFGLNVTLEQNVNGTISFVDSELEPIEEFPYKGGTHNAPVVIYEKPIYEDFNEIPRGKYVAGFDGTKINESVTSDSVGVMYIYKRRAGVTGMQDQIVAQIASRPKRSETFFKQCMLLLIAYNAECLPEHDRPFVDYLRRHNADRYIADSQGTNLRITRGSVAQTNYGLPATSGNKNHYMELIKNKLWEEVEVGTDNNGDPITALWVETIPDPMLLEEIIKYGNYKNYDRLAALGHALIWDEELTIHKIGAKRKNTYEEYQAMNMSNKRQAKTKAQKIRRRFKKRY